MREAHYLILGAGYTGRRVAGRLCDAGGAVVVTTRDPRGLADLAQRGATVVRVDADEPDTLADLARVTEPGVRVLHSVPALRRERDLEDPTPRLLEALGTRPARVVYLSTTGVYGDATEVDETTLAEPITRRQVVRRQAEECVAAGPWSSLIVRPAAIYGPGRGVHVAIREGRYRLVGDGRNVVSRIHVDDLARLSTVALDSELEGAYPVADDEPCEARVVAAFCAARLGLPTPSSTTADGVPETLRVTRRVDGRAIRTALGIELRYPSYRSGIPACSGDFPNSRTNTE